MRTNIFTLATLLLAVPAFSKGKQVDLTGSWKETRRFTTDKKVVTYTDTLRIDFTIGNEYLWQKAGSFMFKGTYKASEDLLDLGARTFTILQMTPGQLVLKDDAGMYELSKYTKVADAEDNSKASSSSRGSKADEGEINKAEMTGKWEVYKRTSSVQMKELDYTKILRTIEIHWNGDKIDGVAMPAQYLAEGSGCMIQRFEKNTIYCSGGRAFVVRRCSGGELIIQEGTMTYFFKKFK